MYKQKRHLITSIMLGDLVAHRGHQFVYGWYLRHTICAEILLWLMGRTEGLDCQHGVSPHFSFQASKVRPALPYYTQTSLFCHHLSVQTESSGIWRRDRECQLALASLTILFFSSHNSLGQLVPNFSLSKRRGNWIFFSAQFQAYKWDNRVCISCCLTLRFIKGQL